MKQYLVFGFDDYYPAGGWSDYLESFDSLEEAKEFCEKLQPEFHNYQIVSTKTMNINFTYIEWGNNKMDRKRIWK